MIRVWTPAMDEVLTGLWGLMSCNELSKRISTEFNQTYSRNAIISRAHRLALTRLDNPVKNPHKRKARAKAKPEIWVGGEIDRGPAWTRIPAKQKEQFLSGGRRCFCGKFALPGKSHCYGDLHGEFHGH